MTGTLHEDQYTFFYMSLIYSLNQKCFRRNLYRKSEHTFYVRLLYFENRAVYEIIWKNIVERGRPQTKIWRELIAYCITKTTNTHTHDIYYLLLVHCNNGRTNAPQCYVVQNCLSCFFK